jgi:hypothetical protein
MTLARQRHMVKGIGLALILSLVVVASYSGTGYGKEYLGEEEVLPAHYPKAFDGLGHVDRIGKDEIVVDDSLHHMASRAAYATPTTRYGSPGDIHVGDFVGFMTNSKNEITSIWLITKSKR